MTRYRTVEVEGLPIFYRGNKRVEPDETGVWQLAKNSDAWG